MQIAPQKPPQVAKRPPQRVWQDSFGSVFATFEGSSGGQVTLLVCESTLADEALDVIDTLSFRGTLVLCLLEMSLEHEAPVRAAIQGTGARTAVFLTDHQFQGIATHGPACHRPLERIRTSMGTEFLSGGFAKAWSSHQLEKQLLEIGESIHTKASSAASEAALLGTKAIICSPAKLEQALQAVFAHPKA